jgi:hypothetical protein
MARDGAGVGMRGMMRQLTGCLAGCMLLASVVAGCTSARSALGTSDSSCYRALPAATNAVGAHGRLLSVDLFTWTELRQRAPELFTALGTKHASPQRVCVIAFDGKFDKTSVLDPLGRSSGRLAVVVLATPSNQLLGTVIFTRAPLHLGHTRIG